MPRFEPFPGLRYDPQQFDLAAVTAPPYDVLDADDRARLAARDDHNIVTIDLPIDDHSGADRYEVAGVRFRTWQGTGVLVADAGPTLTRYRMSFTDEAGRAHQTLGVIGALEVSRATDGGDVLPHERTTPKATTDRLQLTEATAANLSPVWGLSLAAGLTDALAPDAPAGAAWTDDDGVHHESWTITDEATIARVRGLVEGAPVMIADGHHRYDVALTYRDERRVAAHGQGGTYDLTMAFVVELTPDQLVVQAIHRLLDGFGSVDDLTIALHASFELVEVGAVDRSILDRMVTDGALALVRPDGTGALLRPRPDAFPPDDVDDLDSARLDHALAAVPHTQTYQHGVERALALVTRGEAGAAVLLRPVTVPAIEAKARARGLMPPKSTFFAPKPATGVVLRAL